MHPVCTGVISFYFTWIEVKSSNICRTGMCRINFDLMAKFIVKVANHYKTARLTPKEITSPFDSDSSKPKVSPKSSAHLEVKSAKYGVIPLILLTIIICVCAYYFGL